METTLVPTIVASKNGGVFEFGAALPRQEAVCVVPEYNCLGGDKSVVKTDELHSSFGRCVPENRSAIVFVADAKAHAALIDSAEVRFGVPSQGKCVSARGAVLRSQGGAQAVASLEEN